MNDIVNEVNDRLDNSLQSIDMEIKEKPEIIRDCEYYEQLKLDEAPKLIEEQEKNNHSTVINEFTGEIYQFRSLNALGSYCCKEICTEPSETDSKMYEPLETTIEKCSRGPALRQFMKNQDIIVDGYPDPDLDKDFDVTMAQGYDVADTYEPLTEISEAMNQTKPTTNEAKQSAKEVETGKSDGAE